MFDFGHYQNVCLATASDDKLFNKFRSEKTFTDMLEHVTYDEGGLFISLRLKKHIHSYLIGSSVMIVSEDQ